MKYIELKNAGEAQVLLKRAAADVSQLEEKVSAVMNAVRKKGDAALKEFTEKFDGVRLDEFRVSASEFTGALNKVSPELKNAIQLAKNNIEKFHGLQKTAVVEVETSPGVKCWRKSIPIEKVGLYIPGGSAPLFSTILMLAVPAKLAGCREIMLCTPPSKDGSVNPAILFAAQLCGVNRIYKVGGAQAIAAMAYGTETIPKMDKIFGPGNAYVTCAKQLIAKEGMAIDIPAGPSELAIYADETVPASFIAADLLSQCEHGPDSQVVLVSTQADVLKNVMHEVEKQVEALPRKEIARQSLNNSFALLAKTEPEAMQLLNDYAPEHLILACANAREMAERVTNAGSVFLGAWSPESAGDYASGTNHTLPTNGFARAWSGVSLDSFVKKVTFQEITQEGIRNIGPSVELMAEAEGLFAHKNAVTVRINNS